MAWTPLPGLEKKGEFDLRSVAGPAQPGDYVAITVLGAAQVKVDPAAAIAPGQRLTAAADGTARPLLTRTIDGMVVSEGAPAIGVALGSPKDGLVWVLVNPQ